MELRHLRYFIAVAEEGSLTVAAQKRLFTSQPSLSRQIKDLEDEVGASLMSRSARGIELTEAGKAFLEHARLALNQVQAGIEAARRVAHPSKPTFAVGFLTGQEVDWLPDTTRLLRDQLPNMEMTVSSQYSPDLADALMRGKLDIAFLRQEHNTPELEYIKITSEPFVVIMPSDHRLAAGADVDVQELANEVFIGASDIAYPMRLAIENYLSANGLDLQPSHRIHNLTMAMSLIASTRGVALLPAYAENFLPWSVTSRPLRGQPPMLDLMIGYHKDNTSPLLKLFLSRLDELIKRTEVG
ncbi:LysR family transcriptional regulator [Pseudomonas gingeri]|uniref:LysR family transcriptional regulator n=1 Tax=Pseudomonas gingeri TaxID=117681 RepID=A0A7Y7XIF5_9PSED|nr:LysR family transcriptional regulator [Pseudomonas gingeri]NWA27756.1 LysR family transcriptional regulator [Pseudomonas gingeri]NWC00242.1 LysR family transcriptional regulator [Pseudomonas gingeri]NWD69825.1 LysR family transcriptional regulator [Pseudomonas gingeri]NWD78127.1 LysR family transcriptional regulator [Pseudomonas gingeri]